MRRCWDRSYRGAGRRADLFPALGTVLLMFLLAPAVGAFADVQSTSGAVQLGNSLQYGSTSYTVRYSYPSTVQVGTNLTITVTLHVDSLTGLVEYVTNYGIVAGVFVGDQRLEGSVSSGQNSTFLYPGSSWGPYNITIPLTANNTGLIEGSLANGTVSLTLGDTVYYGSQQLNVYVTEPPMQGAAGSLVIQNAVRSTVTSTTAPGPGHDYFPYAFMVIAGVVLILGSVFWPRKTDRG